MQVQGPFRPATPLILASASPRRQALLTSLGLHFQVLPSQAQEPDPGPKETAEEYVQRMAELKARAIQKTKRPGVIIAADTVVVIDNHILGKPQSESEALDMLHSLNNTTHTVFTACCLLSAASGTVTAEETFTVSTLVSFFPHSQETLAAYVQTGEPMDKAGGYAIQGVGAFLVASIQGSYSNVVGLPLGETLNALMRLGAITLASTPCTQPDAAL